MSVQRAEVHWTRYLDGNRRVVLEADHARIVAEAGAAVFAFHPEWTVTGMCDSDCLACRRLTELITERSAGYEEGKADAEQAHAAAWDRATFDSTAYEQGKRDAAEEARAAERRHWEARFRNAEQAHAAAVAEANLRWDAEVTRALDEGEKIGRLYGSTPRTLAESDPEPAVGSVVLDGNGRAWQRTYVHAWCTYGVGGWTEWESMLRLFAPFTLIHDGGAS